MKNYYQYTKDEFVKNSKIKLVIEENNEVIFKLLADEYVKTIKKITTVVSSL